MDPFRVTCETCKSRLKVRSAEAVGEIHACPKCGSMVQIVPPADWMPGPAAAAGAIAASLVHEPAVSLSTTASTVLPADFGIDLSVAPTVDASPMGNHCSPAEPAIAPQCAAPAEVAGGISPVVWCAIGGAALFLVGGLTFVLWPGGTKSTPTPVAARMTVSPHEAIEVQSDPGDKQIADEQSTEAPLATTHDEASAQRVETTVDKPIYAPDNSATVAVQDNSLDPEPPQIRNANSPNSPTPGEHAAPNPANAATDPALVGTHSAAAHTPSLPAQASARDANPILKIDPLDFDPEHVGLPGSSTSEASAGSAASSSIAPDAAATAPAVDGNDSQPPLAPANASLDSVRPGVQVRRGPAVENPSTTLDAAARLAAQYPSLQLAEMPLSRFIDTLSQLSGVSISLDPIALERNGMSPRTPVSAAGTNVTLEKLLQDTLSALRLELSVNGGRVAIVLANEKDRRKVEFDVTDLADNGDAGPLAKLLERFVAPGSWKSGGGAGTIENRGATLHIDQTLAVRREALIFCERLRLARGLSLRSKYPAELLTIEAPYTKLHAKLQQPTTFTFVAGTRLADVIQEWQAALGVTVLVDWATLQDVGFTPSSPLACSAIDRPWIEALDGVLTPLGLAWWVADAETIQITTADALEQIERVEFYAVPKSLRAQFTANEQLIAALEMEIAERPNHAGRPGSLRITLDEPSGLLIVRGTPDVHRFLSERFKSAQ